MCLLTFPFSILFNVGRPKGVKEQDVYICDYRLDKSAHLFYKIHRNRYPVCTKTYAFNHFPKRLAPKRDFSVSTGGFYFWNPMFISKPSVPLSQVLYYKFDTNVVVNDSVPQYVTN